MIQLTELIKCCGCQACEDACKVKAVTMEMNRGFLRPHIDTAKCIDCKNCEKVCPIYNHAVNSECEDYEHEVWAAWNSDDKALLNSTSGGIFPALAKKFLVEGGYICGCEFFNDYKSCRHIVTNDPEKLEALIHSKYFQSDMSGVYNIIQKLLRDGQRVMFCGTPCQSAALFNYINETERENLFIVDLFCKGVPSPLLHEKFVEMLEKKERSKVIYYRSKSKVRGWGKHLTEIKFENKKHIFIRSPLDNLFVTKALSVRSSCSLCEYKGTDRVSDLTIGDYWGVKGIDKKTVEKGVSAIVVNTEKGELLLDSLDETVTKQKRSLFDVSNKNNPGYSQRITLNKDYEQFYTDLETQPVKKVIKKYAQDNSYISILCRKARWALSKIKYISLTKFIYINFLSRHVKRSKGAYIIPGHHTCFEFEKGSLFILEQGKALINFRKPKGSKAEAWIQLNENAKFIVHKGLDVRNCRFVVQKDAVLDIVDLEMNGMCNIVVRDNVRIGDEVMIARDVTIYDSDYHPFSLGDDIQRIITKPVDIKDHVWIGNGATIMKGVTIGEGSVVGAKSFVIKNVKPHTMVSGNPAKEICRDILWGK